MINRILGYLYNDAAPIYGKWIEAIQPPTGITKGFILYDNGRAASINTVPLMYHAWRRSGNNLILIGKSIGSDYTIDFTETMRIQELRGDNLVLARDGETLIYMRID